MRSILCARSVVVDCMAQKELQFLPFAEELGERKQIWREPIVRVCERLIDSRRIQGNVSTAINLAKLAQNYL